jgi:hypothetical protein
VRPAAAFHLSFSFLSVLVVALKEFFLKREKRKFLVLSVVVAVEVLVASQIH